MVLMMKYIILHSSILPTKPYQVDDDKLKIKMQKKPQVCCNHSQLFKLTKNVKRRHFFFSGKKDQQCPMGIVHVCKALL